MGNSCHVEIHSKTFQNIYFFPRLRRILLFFSRLRRVCLVHSLVENVDQHQKNIGVAMEVFLFPCFSLVFLLFSRFVVINSLCSLLSTHPPPFYSSLTFLSFLFPFSYFLSLVCALIFEFSFIVISRNWMYFWIFSNISTSTSKCVSHTTPSHPDMQDLKKNQKSRLQKRTTKRTKLRCTISLRPTSLSSSFSLQESKCLQETKPAHRPPPPCINTWGLGFFSILGGSENCYLPGIRIPDLAPRCRYFIGWLHGRHKDIMSQSHVLEDLFFVFMCFASETMILFTLVQILKLCQWRCQHGRIDVVRNMCFVWVKITT